MNRTLELATLVLLVGCAAPSAAQLSDSSRVTLRADSSRVAVPSRSWVPIGSEAEDRIRTAQLRGHASPDGFLIRSPSSWAAAAPGRRVELLAPVLRAVHNSALPSPRNDGGLWAGRGFAYQATAGVRVTAGPLQLTLAPRVSYVENRDFNFPVVGLVDSSVYRPRWRYGQHSLDLPVRMGPRAFREVDLGQSSAVLRARGVALGASTEFQWWGPGIRNALVLSSHAPGFPHLFAGTAHPWRTRAGTVSARWTIGALTESPYFDVEPGNDLRAHSAFALAFTPAAEPGVSVGVARAVYTSADGAGEVLGHAGDVFLRWQASDADGTAPQLLSVFARWVFPGAGAEVYGEWAWHQLPPSARALLTAPNRGRGYTVGGQWLRELRRGGGIRLQAEVTDLEESPVYRVETLPSFYASASVPQGYTHRGRALGAFIGPGASSQWLAADWMAPRGRAGLFAGRVRWDNDAYVAERPGNYHAHDVSLLLGARGAVQTRVGSVGVELQREKRLNYLFTNPRLQFGGEDALDVENYTLRITLSP